MSEENENIEGVNDNHQDDEQAIEQEARTMGWVPKNEFRSGDDRWVDAKTFVEHGRNILPILRKNNQELHRQIKDLRQEREGYNQRLATLENAHLSATQAAVDKAVRDLKAQLKEAKQSGDVDRELEITDAIEEVRQHKASVEARQNTSPQPQVNHEYESWLSENTWYGKDQDKTDLADGYAQKMIQSGQAKTMSQRDFYQAVSERVNKTFGNTQSFNRVSSPRGSSSSSESSGQSYSDLDAFAKAACDKQAAEFVGKNPDFKTKEEYRRYFCKVYFSPRGHHHG